MSDRKDPESIVREIKRVIGMEPMPEQ